MAKIKNTSLKGLRLSFKAFFIAFDNQGISDEIAEKDALELSKLSGYELIEEKKETKANTVKDKKEEVEEDNNEKVKEDTRSISDIKKELDEKGIEYNKRAKKEELLKLLEN